MLLEEPLSVAAQNQKLFLIFLLLGNKLGRSGFVIKFSNNILYECRFTWPKYFSYVNSNGLVIETYSYIFAIRKLSLRERVVMLLGHYGF